MDIGRMVGQLWRLLPDDEKEVVTLLHSEIFSYVLLSNCLDY